MNEAIDRLREIQDEIEELVNEAGLIIRENAGDAVGEVARAESYWMAHIRTAVRRQSGYLGGSFHTMDDTIEELAPRKEEA